MLVPLYTGIVTSSIVGNKNNKYITKIDKNNKDIITLKEYIKILEERLMNFFEVDEDEIIPDN